MARVNVEFSDRASQLLEDLAHKQQKTKSELMRTAIGLLVAADEASEEGGTLAITKDGKIEKEIILPA